MVETGDIHLLKDEVQRALETKGRLPRLLLIDDDPVFGTLLEGMARSQQIPLRFRSNISDLEKTDLEQFDVGILDYDLGTITGSQLSSMMGYFLEDFPVLLISGYRSIDPKHWGKNVKDFVSKSSGAVSILTKALRLFQGNPPPATRV